MPRTTRRPARAALLSAALVLAPAAGAAACASAGTAVLRRAATAPDAAGVLLGLAALTLALVLVWAAAAAGAGVRDAWACAGRTGVPRPRTAAPLVARGRTAAVQAGVAALVVAALTAPAASASPGAAGAAGATAGPAQVVQVGATAGTDEDGPSSAGPAPATTTPTAPTATWSGHPGPAPPPSRPADDQAAGATTLPGSWGALAAGGFRAPRGASPAATALVTSPPARATTTPGGPGPAASVVVLAGDSLWSIAARHLGEGADDLDVARAWPRWFEVNRHVVGDDPDLLLPGQQLVVPEP